MDASARDERYAAEDMAWSPDPNVFVAKEVEDITPGRALDVAAGEARHAIWLAQRGWQVTAVDWSATGLAKGRPRAQAQGLDDIIWEVADITSHRLGDEFDLAVVAYFQAPAEQRRVVLRKAFEGLVPGGSLVVVAHDTRNLTEGTGGPANPDVLYSADDVLADLAGLDHEVRRADVAERTVSGAPRPALDCVVHAIRV